MFRFMNCQRSTDEFTGDKWISNEFKPNDMNVTTQAGTLRHLQTSKYLTKEFRKQKEQNK